MTTSLILTPATELVLGQLPLLLLLIDIISISIGFDYCVGLVYDCFVYGLENLAEKFLLEV